MLETVDAAYGVSLLKSLLRGIPYIIVMGPLEPVLGPLDTVYRVKHVRQSLQCWAFNHLTPNGHFSGRTTPLTYRCCIFFIYSTDIHTEYFKRAAYSPFFPLQNVVYFICYLF
jgi:hypothetical protein